ncbi:Zinc finger CCCH domain-containing protein 24 [Hibiscus syriacus]|uniref:Zinc finger CCCH domain-containing protein 24 n=1 Tax=Hibiscus syriacus TaxID=106335 RepID=A0A6A2XJP7_HIBSY|nr:Zinc finger CCCH domain-containing protein 24 [Hibiscus syriacus]
MCYGWERLNRKSTPITSNSSFEDSRHPSGFKRSIEHDPSSVDEVGFWYGRQKGSKQMVNEERTPLMVASITALHCAASGGAVNVIDVVKLLLAAGADANIVDANGHLPVDVIVVPPKLRDVKLTLEELLATESYSFDMNSRVSAIANSDSPLQLPLRENGSLSSGSDSPKKSRPSDAHISSASEKKEYPIDPSLPDVKNSIYSTDEFRMYSFKVRPCSRAYSHDWTECPFVHPGENARRRDPRKFHYSCVPCPDFRKGVCRRGDMCEYAHGVFECWLHPAQYRTRLCKDGTSCARRVCFFAHMPEELRPLYVSTGSAVPSPRSSTSGAAAMDFAATMSLLPGSPSSVSVMSPSPFTPPSLHLPGSNLQSSRLRSSLNARDIQAEDFNLLPDFDVQQHQLINELSGLTQPPMSSSSFNRSGRMKTLTRQTLMISFLLRAPPHVQREKQQQFHSLSSRELGLSSRELGSGSTAIVGSPPRRADFPWVQSLVKESPSEIKEEITAPVPGEGSSMTSDPVDNAVLGAWLKQMQLDQLVAQPN